MPDTELEKLQRRIDDAKSREGSVNDAGDTGQAMGNAMRLVTELVAGTLVGGAIGFFIDRWLDTSPWFLIVCFLLGAGAGFSNMRRDMMKDDK